MNEARLAILVLAGASLGCRPPCKVVAAQAIALDESCMLAAKELNDGRLAAACGLAYTTVRSALVSGACSCEIGER